MIGKTISHYRILDKLGEGGMGVVYSAEDTRLKRTVALKFLSPRILGTEKDQARLMREAQAAAGLSHPAICTVHEVDEAQGRTFIAMELIEGEGLRAKIESGPLPLNEALSIAIQIAEGLAEAHAKGVVHRDIKPANLVVTTRGRVKIMDFGLARLGESTGLTKAGTTVGTIAYMSPEQAQGEELDHRTDIWSLGVVLYEMVAGRRPFGGHRDQAVIYSIVNEEPQPVSAARPEVPPGIENVVSRMLAKDPASRHQHARDVVADLQRFTGAGETVRSSRRGPEPEPGPSVAVLPFADMSPQGDQEYFCDGIAEELINALTHVGGLKVSSRTSSFQFKSGGHDVREIGRKLGARAVLEGSVRKAGSRLRITAQLVDVTNGYHLWSERFDRDMDDVFAIQDEISTAIVNELQPKLLGKVRAGLVKRHTVNQEAYDAYLRGRWFWKLRTHDGLTKAIECFKKAIELAPDYAVAYAGMADSYNDLADYSPFPPENTIQLAREAAQKALELDDSLAEAHASLGQIKSEHDCDWEGAEKEFKRAIALDPDYAPAHYWHGHLLSVTEGLEEALREMREAERLEPHSLIIKRNIGYYLFVAGEYDSAVRKVRQTLEMDPDYSFAHFVLGMTYTFMSRYEEALEEFDEEERVQGGPHPLVAAWRGLALARSGREEEAKRIRADLADRPGHKHPWPSGMALLCLALDRGDEAYEWLEKARVQGDAHLFIQLSLFRRPDVAGGDPRFLALLERMGLESR